MTNLFLDFESRSEISLPDRGLDNYLKHSSTRALMLGWAVNDSSPNLWQAHINGQFCSELKDALSDPHVRKIAYNAPFEHGAFKHLIGTEIPYEQWIDVLIWARHLSVTGDLATVGKIFGLDQDEAKIKDGKRLIDKFCSPTVPAKETPLFGMMPCWYADWDSDPADWERFCEYCFTPDHTLLSENLLWKPARDFSVGDTVLGFDENGPRRKFRRAFIEKISYEKAPIFKVTLKSGKVFRVTREHLWLTCQKLSRGSHKSSNKLRWLRTDQLSSRKYAYSRIPRLIEPWISENSYEAGWLAGVLDGEGSYSANHLSVGQNPGIVQTGIREYLSKYAEISSRPTNSDGSKCETIHVKGHKLETLRVLGRLRPRRLLSKVNFDTLGQVECRDIRDGVVSVTPDGAEEIIKIQTSTGTLVVDGYPMHNCKQDVRSERALWKRMQAFPLPESEQEGWCVDQVINARGLPIDLDLVRGSNEVATQIKKDLFARLKEITGVENTNSGPQMLKWLETQGYDFSSIGKPFVNRALAGECELTEAARTALEIRKQSSKTSDSKLQRIIDCVSDDGRLRNQFLYMGAPRTGRWSGGGGEVKNVQMQNLPRPTKDVAKNLDLAISLLKNRDYTGIAMEFANPMEVVTSTLRSTIKAGPGKKLLVCDLNAVEFRKLGWITKCESINSVFRTGRDPYKDFGADLFQKPYEEITKEERQNAKPGVLGGGYQLSGGEEYTDENGDIVYSGLMGYARSLQIELDHDLAHDSIAKFRAKYWEVKEAWAEIEAAALKAVRTGLPVQYNDFTFQCFGTKLLRLTLPSGRGLHYIRPQIAKDEKFNKDGITYEGRIQASKAVGRIKIYGGKWVENMCQASSRDLLLHGMILAEKKGLCVVGSTHDELICEVDKDSKFGLDDLRECMVKPPEWAPDLILDAEGYESEVYRKD